MILIIGCRLLNINHLHQVVSTVLDLIACKNTINLYIPLYSLLYLITSIFQIIPYAMMCVSVSLPTSHILLPPIFYPQSSSANYTMITCVLLGLTILLLLYLNYLSLWRPEDPTDPVWSGRRGFEWECWSFENNRNKLGLSWAKLKFRLELD